jgi:hypothetical protein
MSVFSQKIRNEKLFAKADKTIDTQFSLGQQPSMDSSTADSINQLDCSMSDIGHISHRGATTTETFTVAVLVFWVRDARMLFRV